jgi:uncharacterized protein YegP (UPF0339 family)
MFLPKQQTQAQSSINKDHIMSGCYELKLAKNGEFFFNLLAANGQGILKSEMYSSRSAAMNGIASVQTNCGDDGQYECKTSGNDKAYFVLKAKNHQVIGQSQMYESDSGCQNGMESVKANGVSTDIKDLTGS